MSNISSKTWVQKTKNIFWHLPKNLFLNLKFGFPSKKLVLIGITGTDGKTTTSHLVHRILTNSGLKVGLISTTGAQIGDKEYSTILHMTSPDPAIIQSLLKKMANENVTHVVLEVTAHALDQYRYFGCHFNISAITNTSHEHLDYYADIQSYIESKAKLFNYSDFCILNKDDPSYKIIKNTTNSPITTYSINSSSDYKATDIKLDQDHLKFTVNNIKIISDSTYYYQINNILVALAITEKLKINPQVLMETVKNFPEIKGRREEILNDLKLKTIIDFAHTPAALDQTLTSLKKTTKGNLITIFGATGGRDKSKRPLMGKVVSRLANIGIITSDDTRDENINDINQQIIKGIDPQKSKLFDCQDVKNTSSCIKINQIAKKKFVYFNVPNRQDAFNLAIKIAQPNDTIIACGKGHETTILHGNTEYPWSESEAFRTAFKYKNIH